MLYERVAYPSGFDEAPDNGAKDELRALLSQGAVDLRPYGREHGMFFTPGNPYGDRKFRVVRVEDDIGRALLFDYREDGLLNTVKGPGVNGEIVHFQYNQPQGYPSRLNERFLTQVTRSRSVPLPPGLGIPQNANGNELATKSVAYTYDWPNEQSEGGYVDGLYRLWRPLANDAVGRKFASLAALDYITRVSDNIVEVAHDLGDYTGTVGSRRIEVQTRYEKFHRSTSFDKVAAQRYGDLAQGPAGWQPSPDGEGESVQAEFRLSYAKVPRTVAESGWHPLPQAVRQRYLTESPPLPAVSDATESAWTYFPPTGGGELGSALRSTPLPCGVISQFHDSFWDSRSLDASTIQEFRALAQADANRICSWTKARDQEGQTRYYGFNHRGDLLARVLEDAQTDRFLFEDRRVDADGNVVLRTAENSRASSEWAHERGGKKYAYQGVSAPFSEISWRAKNNLLRVEEYPVGGPVGHLSRTDLEVTDDVDVIARLLTLDYKPPYNLLSRARHGVRVSDSGGGAERFQYEVRYAFDDGKLAASGLSLLDPSQPAAVRTMQLERAPHGLLRKLKEVGGGEVRVDFLNPILAPSTDSFQDNHFGPDYRGFIHDIAVDHFDEDYWDEAPGPECVDLPLHYRHAAGGDCSLLGSLDVPEDVRSALNGPDSDNTRVSHYSVSGWPRELVKNSLRASIIRDIDGRPLRVERADGSILSYRYRPEGWVEELTIEGPEVDGERPRGLRVRQLFDSAGNLRRNCEELAPGGCDDYRGKLIAGVTLSQIDADYRLTDYTYDAENRLIRVEGYDELITEYAYDVRDLIVEVVERPRNLNSSTPVQALSLCYDEQGRLIRTVRGGSQILDTARDQCIALLPDPGALDAAPRLPPEDSCTSPGPQDPTIESAELFYDGFGRPSAELGSDGLTTRYRYTHRDEIAEQILGDPSCGASWKTRYAYDAHGQLSRQRVNDILDTTYEYGPWGRSGRIRTPGGGETLWVRDREWRLLWSRDSEGDELVSAYDPIARTTTNTALLRQGDGYQALHEVLNLDPMGRPLSQTITGVLDTGESKSETQTWQWDGLGNLVQQVAQDGSLTRMAEHNLLGWPKKRCHDAGCTASLFATVKYNPRGDVRLAYDPGDNLVSVLRFDEHGRKIAEKQAGELEYSWTYDALGRLTRSLTPGSGTLEYRYDQGGRLAELLQDDLPLGEWTYDRLGRLSGSRRHHPIGGLDKIVGRSFSFDGLGRLATEAIELPELGTLTVGHSWSLADDRWVQTVGFPDGGEESRQYDLQGRRVFQSSLAGDVRYDWIGSAYAGRTHFSPATTTPIWQEQVELDPLLRERAVLVSAGDPLVLASAREVRRDTAGRIGLERSWQGAPGTAYTAYGYDDRFRLSTLSDWTTGEVPYSGGWAQPMPGLDPPGAPGDPAWSFQFDLLDGLEEIHHPEGQIVWQRTGPRTAGGNLSGAAVDAIPITIENGAADRIQRLGDRQYSYDPQGRLHAVAKGGDVERFYLYSAGGDLAAILDGSAGLAVGFVMEGEQMVRAVGPDGQAAWRASWGPGIDRLIGWGQDEARIPMLDRRRNVVGAFNIDQGLFGAHASYSPYGRLHVPPSPMGAGCTEFGVASLCAHPAGMPFGFASAWRAEPDGLLFLRNRWYAPAMRQFMSRDPLGFSDSWNLYAYAGLDPINGWDPWGLSNQGFAGKVADIAVDTAVGSIPVYGSLKDYDESMESMFDQIIEGNYGVAVLHGGLVGFSGTMAIVEGVTLGAGVLATTPLKAAAKGFVRGVADESVEALVKTGARQADEVVQATTRLTRSVPGAGGARRLAGKLDGPDASFRSSQQSFAIRNDTTLPLQRGDGVNPLRTKKVMRDMRGSAIGRKVLDADAAGDIQLQISTASVDRNLFGQAYRFGGENFAVAYARNTQSYRKTAETLIHEGVHALGVGGSRRAEALARLAEISHRGGATNLSAMRRVLQEMKSARVYGKLPWRSGGVSPHFPGLTF